MAKVTTALYGDLAILPYQPIYPVRETLSWLTDVSEAYDGTEQAQSLRSIPRRTYNLQYQLRNVQHMQDAFNTVDGGQRDWWAVPLWPESQYVGNIAGGDLAITCDTVDYPLEAATLALLINSVGDWELVQIAAASTVSITLTAGAAAITGAYLVPVRTGRIVGNVQNLINQRSSFVSAAWMLDESPLVATTAPAQFAGYDLHTSSVYTSNKTIERVFTQREEVADFALGVRDVSSPWHRPKLGEPYSVIGENASAIKAHKQFFYRRRGRYQRFWQPLHEHNLTVINTGTITTTLDVNDNGLTDYTPTRLNIGILKTDGTWITVTAISVAVLTGTTARYTFASALNLPVADIKLVSYLGLNRLDSDQIEITYRATDIAEFAYTALELSP